MLDRSLVEASSREVGPSKLVDLSTYGWWAWCVAELVRCVGRETEVTRLLAALAGKCRLVLVSGDAGVGKTRLVAEAMRRAEVAGALVLRGECLPVAGVLPMLPVVSALGLLAVLDGGPMAAALDAAPGYVRAAVERLLPEGAPEVAFSAADRDGGWQRERLFAGVAGLFAALGQRSGVGLVVEDVHWADSETLDFLTFLAGTAAGGPVTVIATCRADEAALASHVTGWLAAARGAAWMEEISLGPLSLAEVASQVASLAGRPVPPQVVDDLHARAEGNAFFTEQLVAAAMAGGVPEAGLVIPAGLPARLAALLTTRAGLCAGDARAVLAGLAVAGRPLTEELLCVVTGLDAGQVRQGIGDLAAARLLADDAPAGAYRPRHALLAEAVAASLLPGERAALHERVARALDTAGGQALAAEIADHWQAAGRAADELRARLTAAEAAERVFGYFEAAAHWQRAIDLLDSLPDAAARTDVPGLYVREIDALHICGEIPRAWALAEEAYSRFNAHPDPAIAGAVYLRVAEYRARNSPELAKPLVEKALELYEGCEASLEKSWAWFRYGASFLFHAEGNLDGSTAALSQALDIAEAAGARTVACRVLLPLARDAFLRGDVVKGQSLLARASVLAEGDDQASVWLADYRCNALVALGQLDEAADTAGTTLAACRQVGLHTCLTASFLTATAAEALLALGRTSAAAALIDPCTQGPPVRERWGVHQRRAQVDLLRGHVDAAAERQRQIASYSFPGSVDNARRYAEDAADVWLWLGRPADGLADVQAALARHRSRDVAVLCGRLLAAGMRACADLAEQGRARRDPGAAEHAADAADDLVSWVTRMSGAPFVDHPYMAAISADRATWEAERTRLAGTSDPTAWEAAAKAWHDLGRPHRAGYAWWRQALAQLEAGQPATRAAAAVRAADAAAHGHRPLLGQVRLLADRARILLQPAAAIAASGTPGRSSAAYGLTSRELTVLRLMAAGRSNAQIGAELYISPSTARVHVSAILRKLGVRSRVHAATLAERAGLLSDVQV